jgi:hypothetical protein
VIYSTCPKIGTAENGASYYLKGPDAAVVAAEALAYELAGAVNLAVPEHALCEVPGVGVFFASKEVRFRSALDVVMEGGLASNPELLSDCIAFDTWIANDDRNMGNIVMEPERIEGHLARLLAIDFEKSRILRGENMLLVDQLAPRSFWPRELLGQLCDGQPFPDGACSRIASVSRDRIDGVFEALAWELADLDLSWRDSAVYQLARRATQITDRVREVWDS